MRIGIKPGHGSEIIHSTYRTPHALQSVLGPSGPTRHWGVSVLPQLRHTVFDRLRFFCVFFLYVDATSVCSGPKGLMSIAAAPDASRPEPQATTAGALCWLIMFNFLLFPGTRKLDTFRHRPLFDVA